MTIRMMLKAVTVILEAFPCHCSIHTFMKEAITVQ